MYGFLLKRPPPRPSSCVCVCVCVCVIAYTPILRTAHVCVCFIIHCCRGGAAATTAALLTSLDVQLPVAAANLLYACACASPWARLWLLGRSKQSGGGGAGSNGAEGGSLEGQFTNGGGGGGGGGGNLEGQLAGGGGLGAGSALDVQHSMQPHPAVSPGHRGSKDALHCGFQGSGITAAGLHSETRMPLGTTHALPAVHAEDDTGLGGLRCALPLLFHSLLTVRQCCMIYDEYLMNRCGCLPNS